MGLALIYCYGYKDDLSLVLDLREGNDYLVSQTCTHIIRTQFNNCCNIVCRVLWKRNGSNDSP